MARKGRHARFLRRTHGSGQIEDAVRSSQLSAHVGASEASGLQGMSETVTITLPSGFTTWAQISPRVVVRSGILGHGSWVYSQSGGPRTFVIMMCYRD